MERINKFSQICALHDASLILIQAKVLLPKWNYAISATGCSTSEDRGRLCDSGCAPCNVARIEHSKAADIEHEFQLALVQMWQDIAPTTGGCYITNLEPNKNGQIVLVFNLLIPAVAVEIDRRRNAKQVDFKSINFDRIENRFRKFAYSNGAATVEIGGEYARQEKEIVRFIANSHQPAMAAMELLAEQGISQDKIRTYARAAGLTRLTENGKSRRAQRTAWFGILAGRNQTISLAALGLAIEKTNVAAERHVLGYYKILDINHEFVTLQNTATRRIEQIPKTQWRAAYLAPNGAPAEAQPADWQPIHGKDYRGELEQYARLFARGGNLGNLRVKPLQSASEYRRATKEVFGAAMFEAGPPLSKTPESALRVRLAA